MPTSPMPQVTIPLPKVPIMSPQQEPDWAHPRVLSPPAIHTIPTEPIKLLGCKGELHNNYLHPGSITPGKKYRKQAPANFVAARMDKPILQPVKPQLNNFVMNYGHPYNTNGTYKTTRV